MIRSNECSIERNIECSIERNIECGNERSVECGNERNNGNAHGFECKQVKVQVDFTQQGWKHFTRLNRRLGAGFIKAHVLQNELAHYLAAHEAAGVQLDTECQEVRYDDGVYLLLRKSHGAWYITEVFAVAEAVGYQPVYFWQQIKRGVSYIMARVLIGWQRLTGKQSAKQKSCRKVVAEA